MGRVSPYFQEKSQKKSAFPTLFNKKHLDLRGAAAILHYKVLKLFYLKLKTYEKKAT